MARGGARAGAGRLKNAIEDVLPPRKRGRPTNAERAARAAAEAQILAACGTSDGELVVPATAPGPAPTGEPVLPRAAPGPAPAGDIVLPKLAPGAARPALYTPEMPRDVSPKDYFLTLMRDPRVSAERRDRAAQVAIGYVDTKPGEGKKGKKEERQDRANELTKGDGPFAAGRPPLAAVPTARASA